MIRVAVYYPNKAGGKFDHTYYAQNHMTLVKERLEPLGLVRAEIDKGLAGITPDVPAPYVSVGHLVFNSIEDFQKAFEAHGQELMADISNFTDIEPQGQISEIVS